jgi:4a-hydroxytetrahydrobiopterin dehydratase
MKLWKLSDDKTKITRTYTARNFQAAMESLNDIGKIAERENHHPDMHLTGYRNVEIVLFTHSLGGISLNDIAMAQMIDEEVSFGYSPKWLREHPEAKNE